MLGATLAVTSLAWFSTSEANAAKIAWVDQKVSFTSGPVTIYATFRHPIDDAQLVPVSFSSPGAVPPTETAIPRSNRDRSTHSRSLADWLSEDDVASLRYDKLGSGATGLGPYTLDPASIGVSVFEQESRSALVFLAKRRA